MFHFHMKGLEDYYILNPQWWFDACELVVSQENITSLVATGGHMTYPTCNISACTVLLYCVIIASKLYNS